MAKMIGNMELPHFEFKINHTMLGKDTYVRLNGKNIPVKWFKVEGSFEDVTLVTMQMIASAEGDIIGADLELEASVDTVDVLQDTQQLWRWHRQSENGEVVATSGEGYVQESYAKEKAIELNPGCRYTWLIPTDEPRVGLEIEGYEDPDGADDGSTTS